MSTIRNSGPIACYSGATKDNDIQRKSSSGGLFYAFAERAVRTGGVAVGAAFEEDGSVSLQCAHTTEELVRLMGSKYVQSKSNGIYRIVAEKLKTGVDVVFCATPCQCNALLRFLGGKHPDNLLILDFICHGVPSESSWYHYLNYRAKGSRITDISFRDKRINWGNFGTRLLFDNGTEYFQKHQDDPYMRLFLANRTLRPACHRCRAKGANRSSDITLGDHWGVADSEKTRSGCSVLIVNTELGREKLSELSGKLDISPISYEEAVRNNTNYFNSVGIPFNRHRVLKRLEQRADCVFDHPERMIATSFAEKAIRRAIRIGRNLLSKYGACSEKCYFKLMQADKHRSFESRAACCGCGACNAVCPTGAIAMELDREGFRYPVIDESKCCHCNKCIAVCEKKPI